MSSGGFVCSECGYESAKWMGRCPSCGSWGSFREKSTERARAKGGGTRRGTSDPVRLSEVSFGSVERLRLNSKQLNQFFGGGLASGSVILLSGEPGIGKSTLLMQLPSLFEDRIPVLYASGEETAFQVSDRAKRVGVEDVWFVATQNLEDVLEAAERLDCRLLIVDSVQTFRVSGEEALPGSPSQVRMVAERLVELAKTKGVIVFLVGHITKSGTIAGPKLLEHIVDVVIYLEGDRRSPLRVMKCVKNRFGPTDNVVLFEMTSSGLVEVEDPSRYLIEEEALGKPGVVLSSVVEGTRALLVEVQALVAPSVHPAAARRVASMFDIKRLFFILAVMEKHLGISFAGMDVYLNIPGGLMIRDTSVDLAVVAAVYSSFVNRVPEKSTLFVGEVGLAGEIRWVRDLELRLAEADAMGIERALIPRSFKGKINKEKLKNLKVELLPVGNITEAMEVFD